MHYINTVVSSFMQSFFFQYHLQYQLGTNITSTRFCQNDGFTTTLECSNNKQTIITSLKLKESGHEVLEAKSRTSLMRIDITLTRVIIYMYTSVCL